MKIFSVQILFLVVSTLAAQVIPLEHGHAHNDYLHNRPLYDALENGFTSIEIDVFLHDSELKVSHLPIDLDKKQNLEQLYLDPIEKIIKENGGFAFKGSVKPVIFMIDFKTGPTKTYGKLKEILKKYESIVSVYQKDSVIHQRAVNILISGNTPLSETIKEDSAMATIDGRIQSADDSVFNSTITRYSSAWRNYFSWKGAGNIPSKQAALLDSLVRKVHAMNKQIRFYGIPDKPKVWRTLLNAGVDWINTDKLVEFGKLDKMQ